MKRHYLLLFLLLATQGGTAHAADWVEVNYSPSRIQYVDMDELTLGKDGLVQIHLKSLITTPERFYGRKYPVYAIKYPVYSVEKTAINCDNQTLSNYLHIRFYDVFKNEIYSDKTFFPKFNLPTVQSGQARLVRTVCDCVRDNSSHYECHSPSRWNSPFANSGYKKERYQSLPPIK